MMISVVVYIRVFFYFKGDSGNELFIICDILHTCGPLDPLSLILSDKVTKN